MTDASGESSRTDLRLALAGARLAAARSHDEVIAVLGQTARGIVGSDGIAVVLREDGFCHYVAEDANRVLWKGHRYPLETCVSGWAMRNDETVVIPDIYADTRVPVALYETKSILSLVMAPIGSPRPVAALGAYWCAMVVIDTATVSRVGALARLAGEALARVRAGPDARDDGVNEGVAGETASG